MRLSSEIRQPAVERRRYLAASFLSDSVGFLHGEGTLQPVRFKPARIPTKTNNRAQHRLGGKLHASLRQNWKGREKKNVRKLPVVFSAAQIQLSHLRPGANRAGSGVKRALLHFITAAFLLNPVGILCQDFPEIKISTTLVYTAIQDGP